MSDSRGNCYNSGYSEKEESADSLSQFFVYQQAMKLREIAISFQTDLKCFVPL